MLRWRFFVSAVLVVAISIPAAAAPRDASREDHKTVDAQSSAEFQAQVAAIIQAYQKHDTVNGRQLIEQFRLPNAQSGLRHI